MSSSSILGKLPNLALFRNAYKHAQRTAVVDCRVEAGRTVAGQRYSYAQLLAESKKVAGHLTCKSGSQPGDLDQERIAFFLPPGFDYVRTQWGVWRAGGVAVPLALSHPAKELEYTMKHSRVSSVVTTLENMDFISSIATPLSIPIIVFPDAENEQSFSQQYSHDPDRPFPDAAPIGHDRNAMIIYTSGTTGKPKGVVTTHGNIQSQVDTLHKAWKWNENDKIINVLPLHHVHGVVNVLSTALYSGATLEMLDRFDAAAVFDRVLNKEDPLSLFMAVPTIYSKLVSHYDSLPSDADRQLAAKAWGQLRLMVSGSSALPAALFERWESITGQRLLERYGMTEIGMALGNPIDGDRVPASVGFPFPGVQVAIDNPVEINGKTTGELLVKGPQIFKEYWDNEKATKAEINDQGYFKTGDTVERDESGRFFIKGRTSVDIIKYSGYKVSALEIERELLTHPSIEEVAVLGIPNDEYGQIVGAVIVIRPGCTPLSLEDLKQWSSSRLAYYKQPRVVKLVESIPKNAMSKINKKQLLAALFPTSSMSTIPTASRPQQ
eukprot:gene10763-12535_t